MEEKPLRLLSVQLLKRYRDLACDRRSYKRCPSVLLSKLAAEAPGGAGLYNDLRRTIQHLVAAVALIPPPVPNPRCVEDILSDRWPESANDRDQFVRDLRYLDTQLGELEEEGSQAEKKRILEELFGEQPARRAFEAATSRLGQKSSAGDLRLGIGRGAMGAGTGSAHGIAVPKHRFYGKQ